MIVLIDNYDSFTFNLFHYLGGLGADVVVYRNDKVAVGQVLAMEPEAIVLSPGPRTPRDAGICLELIAKAAPSFPVLGVCLGHQAIGQAFGGEVVRAPVPVHGKLSEIRHQGTGIFRGINAPFKATRYHSLVVDRASLLHELVVTAETDDGLVMGLAHRTLAVHGVQFHPESIASEYGHLILRNFLEIAAAWNAATGRHPAGVRTRRGLGDVKVTDELKGLIAKAATGATLSREEAARGFDTMMSGEATPSQMGALLMALRVRGETVDEITGAVTAMRDKMLRVAAPADAIDVVGTGGDASGSFNISTCAALIVAGAGVPVAKHGNRALSSRSGAADVLAALGVNIDLSPEGISRCIKQAGIGFMFAPAHHPAMKNVGPTRVELGTRTIFNLLGPLSNPAGVKRQMVGVFSRQWIEPLALVLKNLGSESVWVVHGSDGLDEITTAGPTYVAALENGTVRTFEITPEELGLERVKPAALQGGSAKENAQALVDVLKGKGGALRDVAILNAAAALTVAGRAKDLKQGLALAQTSIDSGEAAGRLQRLVAISNA
jgi:anthranilate synthase/phosphoribosyltransferase